MAEFFYTRAGERQGPVTRDTLRDLIDRGEVNATDYFWFTGMDEWAIVGDGALPHAGAAPAPQAESTDIFAPSETANDPFPAPASTVDSSPATTSASPMGSVPAANPVAAPSPVGSTFGSGSVTSGAQGDVVGVKDIALKMPKPLWLVIPAVSFILAGVLYGITIIGLIVAWLPIWLGVLLFQANKALESARASGQRSDIMTAVEKLELYFRINGILFIIGFVLTVVYMIFIFTVGADLLNDLSNL